ncbi:MAG: metallophosphoesterase, partial [Candidatus Latescibacteria bacterium]|nr:metallophosphoesterase [Candidatus Latescibacterota bacterium]
FLLALPLYVYVGWRLVGSVSQVSVGYHHTIRYVMIAVGGWLCSYPLMIVVVSNHRGNGWVNAFVDGGGWQDWVFVYPFWFWAVFAIQTAPYLLASDVLGGVLSSMAVSFAPIFRKYAPLIISVLVLLTLAIRMYVDTRRPRIRQRELRVAGLPEALEGFRIVHVSDVQADPRTDDELLGRYVDLVNGLDADLVLFTGDLVTRGTDHIERGAETLARMQTRYGTFACLGDHDIWSNPEEIQRRLGELGVRMGHNERMDVSIGEANVGLYVMTNAYSDRSGLRGLREGVGGDLAILLSHQPTPDVVDAADRVGYHLMASGHTHGGQVTIQVFGWSLSASLFETRFVSGFYELGRLLLSVNNGLGLTLAPIRFLAPSEVTLIEVLGIEGSGSQ